MKTEKKIGMALCGIFLGITAIYRAEKKEKEAEARKQALIDQGRQCLKNNFMYQEVNTNLVKGS